MSNEWSTDDTVSYLRATGHYQALAVHDSATAQAFLEGCVRPHIDRLRAALARSEAEVAELKADTIDTVKATCAGHRAGWESGRDAAAEAAEDVLLDGGTPKHRAALWRERTATAIRALPYPGDKEQEDDDGAGDAVLEGHA